MIKLFHSDSELLMRVVLIAPLLLLESCAYHRVVVAQPDPANQRYHPVESSALAWGAIERTTVADKCPTNLLAEVRVRTSFLESMGSILTLGFWQPTHIEYRCSKAPAAAGAIEP